MAEKTAKKSVKISQNSPLYFFLIIEIMFFRIFDYFPINIVVNFISFQFFFLENWANLKSYPNLPKFLIDDVIPDVVYVVRSPNQLFWTQR